MLVSTDVIKRIRRIHIATTRLVEDMMSGAYRSAFKGNGMEFEEVREYVPGDDIRSIDWHVTARMNHPFVKIYREERELTVMLVVDVSASSRFGTVNRKKSELIAEVGAVLAFSAIKNQDKVGLILFSDQVEKYVPPRKGVRHVLRVIRELLVFEPKRNGTNISAALAFLSKVQKKSAVCFLISDFLSPRDDSHEIRLASNHHDLIAIDVTDPSELSAPNMEMMNIRDLETGELTLVDTSFPQVQKHFAEQAHQRSEKLKSLMYQLGSGVLELSTDKPYAVAIRKYFKDREKRRR